MRFAPVVAELMTPDPTVLSPDDRIATAAREMALGEIRHLPVVDADGILIGVLSQRDLLVCNDPETRVGEVMKRQVKAVAPETAAHEAAYLLVRDKIGCLPVVSSDGQLVGIITDSDFVSAACVLLGGRVPIDEMELEEHEADRV